jgi:hypothetical protein
MLVASVSQGGYLPDEKLKQSSGQPRGWVVDVGDGLTLQTSVLTTH